MSNINNPLPYDRIKKNIEPVIKREKQVVLEAGADLLEHLPLIPSALELFALTELLVTD